MSAGSLLVVAADADVRRSLAFSLEAEGYFVTEAEVLPTRSWTKSHRFDCTVLDQRLVRDPPYESLAFCIASHPVVLLAAKPLAWLAEWVAEVVETPIVDDELLRAVRRATEPRADNH